MNADSCPFAAGSMLTEDQFFVGRQVELDFITSRMAAAQPTSINVVGEKRIGKSSLLWHFYRTYKQRVQKYGRQASEFVVVYLSLQDVRCQGESNFYQAIAEKLLERPSVQPNLALTEPLRQQPMDKVNFSAAMDKWKQAGVLVVVCLDYFKVLFQHRQEFNDDFYNNLRSLVDRCALMLITASDRELPVYRQRFRLTSDFFNLVATCHLRELTAQEASDLVRLPKTNLPNLDIALSDRRQTLALKWGENHPYLLQLAAVYLWYAKRLDKSDDWAKYKFDQARKNTMGRRFGRKWWLPLQLIFHDFRICFVQFLTEFYQTAKKIIRHSFRGQWWLPLKWIFCDLPIWFFQLSENIGKFMAKIIEIGMGYFLILWLVLAVVGQVPFAKVPDGARQFVCSTLASALGKFCQ